MRWIVALLLAGCAAGVEHGPAVRPTHSPEPAASLTPPSTAAPVAQQAAAPVWNYDVVARYPHDPEAFTQGLVFDKTGKLWETTGLKGKSTLRQLHLQSGQAQVVQKLPTAEFGEGLAISADRFYWLTWQNGLCHTFSWPDGKRAGPTFRYEGEGWGLCSDPSGQLWMSDGSSTLTLRSAQDFSIQRQIRAHSGDAELSQLNELEWIEGKIWANVWGTPLVACIDPEQGNVEGLVDFSGLLSPEEAARADVLNGIAYEPRSRRLFVTGKLWPRLFEVRVRR